VIRSLFFTALLSVTTLLHSAETRLQQVNVKAKRYTPGGDHTESRTIITRDEIRKSGARNLPDLLESREAIQIERYGGQGQLASVRIRGGAPSQVLVLVDGVPVNSSLGGGTDIGSLHLNNIKKVEIIRGGASALLGGGAFAGAILITTVSDTSATEAGLDLFWGSCATWSADGNLSLVSSRPLVPTLHTTLSLSGSDGGYLFPGQLSLKGDGGYTLGGDKVKHRNSGFTAFTGSIASSWNKKGIWGTDVSIRYNDREAGVPGTIDFPTVEATQHDRQLLFSLTAVHRKPRFLSRDNLRLRLFYLQQKCLFRDFSLFSSEQGHDLKKGGIRLHYSADTKNIGFTIGSSAELEKMRSNSLSESNLNRKQFSIWGSSQFRLSTRFLANGNLRFDKTTGFAAALSSKAGAVFHIIQRSILSLKANTGRSYRLPAFSDLFWSETFFAAGNPDLQPEKSINIDLGLESYPAPWFSARIFFFINQVTDLIRWEPSAGGVWMPSNLGKGRIRGLEAATALQKQFGMFLLRLSLNYTLQQVTDTSGGSNDGNQLPRRPFEKAACALTLRSGDSWHFKVEGDYSGFRYINAANTKYLGDCFLLNLSGGIELSNGIRFRFIIRNLLDTAYSHVREYPIPGREYRVESGYRF